ncbi:Solvent efflux pump srpABC operon corepressor [Oligella urethralis]|uniref:IclR family transcriptional regulator n=1 Tax=Oligella urethralis TaxID=90245 RepID=UPI0006616209|nr:IclR family transcriptional regulator [Oligella urethralis]AVL71836.1 IclR family transcriptional regulator [Oligella urethralis]SUA51938.1 Solvent efflux pump srpABC operon corepressor [Oligella urethralis]SUA55727.1 Solvent efflux pump srpABC operon corepressor [Oligella urethralis]
MLDELLATIAQSEAEQDRQFITSLARGLAVLYALRFYSHGISHQQITEMTQLPKATVSRILNTLIKLRFLRKHPVTGLYVSDIHLRELGAFALHSDHLVRDAKPLLMAFAEKYEVSVSLAVEESGEMLYLESIRSPARLAVQLTVGSTVPLIDTAIGRVYYCALTEAQRILLEASHLRPLLAQDYGPKKALLERQMEVYQQYGFCYSVGEFSHDITAIAIPVRNDAAKNGLYALNASVPSSRLDLRQLIEQVAEPLKALGAALEQL